MATKYVTQTEAAELLGIGVRRVQQLRSDGTLPSEKNGSGVVRILRSDVLSYRTKRDTFTPAGR